MSSKRLLLPVWAVFLIAPAAFLIADDTASPPSSSPPPAWAAKQAAEWSADDAKAVLSDSPWAKQVTPSFVRRTQQQPYSNQRPMGRRGGFGFPGGGYPGGGYPGGGYPGGGGYPQQYPQNPPRDDDKAYDEKPPLLTVRWESAEPIRAAELKAHDDNAPTLSDETHYALAVYGVPANMVNGDFKTLSDETKKKTTLSRDGKKDMKPTSVQYLRREDGPVVLFLFVKPKDKKEAIGKDDRRVQFDTQIGRLALSQAFYLEDMTFQGKTEL